MRFATWRCGFTLAIIHWATLGRVTRAEMIEEMGQDYVIAARARGIPEGRITWRPHPE